VANPYRAYVRDLARLLRSGGDLPLGGFETPAPAAPPAGAPRALIFAPHPDDECIVGLLALRLLREAGMRVVNVAVTQGSNLARRAERWEELRAACGYLGFDLVGTALGGLERIDAATRAGDRAHWSRCVDAIAGILREHAPAVVFCPHDADWNKTHIGTHHLVLDALARAGGECAVVETEYWGAMATPNLVVEASPDDLADLMAALSFHVGEVRRNPYHLGLPAWMQDNVRRGAEVAGGQGEAAPAFDFATLYRVSRWKDGRLQPAAPPRMVPAATNAAGALTMT
jgi:LmbE family N-acetylglucosaminyl deacetylase